MAPGRRAVLLLPLAAGACGSDPPPVVLPVSYSHLLPLRLKVASIEIVDGGLPPRPGDLGTRTDPPAAEAVRIMGRERLFAVGNTGQARFRVTAASILPDRNGLVCEVGCRLDLRQDADSQPGYVIATGRANVSGRDADRPRAADLLLRRAMELLNVEFEFQIRRNLRDWLAAEAPGGGAAPAENVTREDLPRP